jgi:hypothetical protein
VEQLTNNHDTISEERLRECPFCGKTPEINDGLESGNFNFVEIACSHPVEEGEDGYDAGALIVEVHADTRKLAIAAWNRRAPLALEGLAARSGGVVRVLERVSSILQHPSTSPAHDLGAIKQALSTIEPVTTDGEKK